jgi:hypothetical protein
MTNTNSLENIKCPACGNEEAFRIAATTIATVTDDGIDDYGDMEWHDDSFAECNACCRYGTLKDFKVQDGLEAGSIARTITTTHSPTPWTYDYSPYTLRTTGSGDGGNVGDEIPAFEVVDADGNKLFDTNENLPCELQEANACLATAAPALLEALLLAQRALNTAPRFRVGDTDSYKIAAHVDAAIEASNTRRHS